MSTNDDRARQHLVTLATDAEDAPDALTLLTALRALQDATADLERVTVETAREAGVSWGDLGRALSRSKQAVCRKYGRPDPQQLDGSTKPRKVSRSVVWGELRVGPGRGVRAGRIVRSP